MVVLDALWQCLFYRNFRRLLKGLTSFVQGRSSKLYKVFITYINGCRRKYQIDLQIDIVFKMSEIKFYSP